MGRRAEIAQFRLEWIPQAISRGNSRAHWGAQARMANKLKDSGLAHGLELKQLTPDAFPMEGQLCISYQITARKHVDFDNLHYGYKYWIDALQVEMSGRRPRRRGAGIIEDDRQIVQSTIAIRVGNKDETLITITKAPPGWGDWDSASVRVPDPTGRPSRTGRLAVPLEEKIGLHT